MNDLLNLLSACPGASLIMASFAAASLYGLYAAPDMVERNLFRPFWLLPQRQYHTLITSAFLHADLPHLFFNSFTFWAFAFPLERRIGTPSFVLLYLFGLLVSDLGTYFKHRADPGYRCLGASGAILAVLFASILYFPGSSIVVFPVPVPVPGPLFALGYLAYSYYAASQNQGRINHDAHLTGALAGIAFVTLADPEALGQAAQRLLGLLGLSV